MLILRSQNLDPYRNLATEAYLLDQLERFGPVLFLWQSDHTVVVGKNQNPWRECDLELLRRDRGLLARRVSGGGTVYHDLGNLNYAFVVPRDTYQEARQFALVEDALRSLGVAVERLGKSSLAVDRKKISGNAFCFRRGAALHHGTLLVSSDLERLHRYLKPVDRGIRTRAIASVPAVVGNLREVVPSLDIDTVAEAMAASFAEAHGGSPLMERPAMLESAELRKLHHDYVAWEWCFGQTPAFTMETAAAFAWGEVLLRWDVEHGRVRRVEVSSSALDGASIGHLEGELLDCPFKETALARRIRKGIGRDGHALLEDLAGWMMKQALS